MKLFNILLSALVLVFVGSAQAGVISSGLSSSSYSESGSWAGTTAEAGFNGGDWNSGNWGIQWLQVDLGSEQAITGVSFVFDQLPNGFTWDKVFVSDSAIGSAWSSLSEVASRAGWSNNGDFSSLDFSAFGRYVEIVAFGGDSWTALGDVNVYGPGASVSEPGALVLALFGLAGLVARRKLV